MKQNLFCVIIVLLLTFSCKRDDDATDAQKKLLAGDWQRLEVQDKLENGEVNVMIPSLLTPGYGFDVKGNFEYKTGFYKGEHFKYIGSFSHYKIEDDSLKLFYIGDNRYVNARISKLTKDTLVLNYQKYNSYYIKKKYDTLNIPNFQQLIISGGMYGSGSSNVFIKEDGTVIYDKREWTDTILNQNRYKATISKKELATIQTRFKKADWPNLKKTYGYPADDVENYQVTIIKDNRILKSVYIAGVDQPAVLSWAYIPTSNIPNMIRGEIVPKSVIDIENFVLKNSGHSLALTNSERYFLSYQLSNARVVTTSFLELYNLENNDTSVSKITSDGRYYKFYFKDKTTKTVDIGYNFLTESNLVNTFVKHE